MHCSISELRHVTFLLMVMQSQNLISNALALGLRVIKTLKNGSCSVNTIRNWDFLGKCSLEHLCTEHPSPFNLPYSLHMQQLPIGKSDLLASDPGQTVFGQEHASNNTDASVECRSLENLNVMDFEHLPL